MDHDPAQAGELPRRLRRFSIPKVAAFTEDDVDRLLGDAGIVRNRAKIEATIANARAALDLARRAVRPGLEYADAASPSPRPMTDVPAITPASKALAKELKKRGFRFVGPTTAYALMQAIGLVNDHIEGCVARQAQP